MVGRVLVHREVKPAHRLAHRAEGPGVAGRRRERLAHRRFLAVEQEGVEVAEVRRDRPLRTDLDRVGLQRPHQRPARVAEASREHVGRIGGDPAAGLRLDGEVGDHIVPLARLIPGDHHHAGRLVVGVDHRDEAVDERAAEPGRVVVAVRQRRGGLAVRERLGGRVGRIRREVPLARARVHLVVPGLRLRRRGAQEDEVPQRRRLARRDRPDVVTQRHQEVVTAAVGVVDAQFDHLAGIAQHRRVRVDKGRRRAGVGRGGRQRYRDPIGEGVGGDARRGVPARGVHIVRGVRAAVVEVDPLVGVERLQPCHIADARQPGVAQHHIEHDKVVADPVAERPLDAKVAELARGTDAVVERVALVDQRHRQGR